MFLWIHRFQLLTISLIVLLTACVGASSDAPVVADEEEDAAVRQRDVVESDSVEQDIDLLAPFDVAVEAGSDMELPSDMQDLGEDAPDRPLRDQHTDNLELPLEEVGAPDEVGADLLEEEDLPEDLLPTDMMDVLPWPSEGCTNTCEFSFNTFCEDGGEGSDYNFCELGTDCADCGPRDFTIGPDMGLDLSLDIPTDLAIEEEYLCTNTCFWADDGDCDDGGVDSDYSICDVGTDCIDCGPRLPDGTGPVTDSGVPDESG